ncbi:hypothetical protein A1F94_008469 [Pyrenophora tritici-repentis]|uniref:Uncharacterized protein n=1 Tax=Pyrenophora tritici-repentis TaxID=45151 RepID=A0A317A8I9_9PLEO|nr:hypothetical protein A1F94_008469 [Pyrenophora tritici-repentis]KAI1516405.1 hypothetical protein Ptr86124_004942 [Pyrenophora tritici-repentis]KAI1685194.1 hypothetical protein KJE20_05478 [Pyrenophora tritici-repentis]
MAMMKAFFLPNAIIADITQAYVAPGTRQPTTLHRLFRERKGGTNVDSRYQWDQGNFTTWNLHPVIALDLSMPLLPTPNTWGCRRSNEKAHISVAN